MYYSKDGKLIEITDLDKFVSIVKNTYKKLYGEDEDVLKRVDFAANWFFSRLKSELMKSPREEIIPTYGKKLDDYGD